MNATGQTVADIVLGLQRQIEALRFGGQLSRASIEAIDVVYHAVTFTRNPRGLELWRQALWSQKLSAEAQADIVEMLEHLNQEVAAGNAGAAEICDCLEGLVVVPAGQAEGGR
jgi:hypothetical protein